MGLLKRAHVRGIQHGLIRRGVAAYPSEKIAEEVADAVADDLTDEEVPEMTDETGLTPEEATVVINKLVDVAEEIAEKTGGARDLELNKVASEVTLEAAANAHATAVILKTAEERKVAGPDIPGQQPPTPDLSATAEAQVDAKDTPSSEVIVPKGESAVDATSGAIGHEEVRADQPGHQQDSPPETIADVKISELISKLSAAASAPGSQGGTGTGGDGTMPTGGGRNDLKTNAGMGKDMIVPQGDTNQVAPEVPVPLKPNPAASDVTKQEKPKNDIQEDVKKAASLLLSTPGGREILASLESDQQQKEAEHDKAASTLLKALTHVAQVAAPQ